jgi:hypothetical protein
MVMRLTRAAALAAVVALGVAGRGLAQYPYQPTSPYPGATSPVSPYLLLNQPGVNPASILYGAIRPQQQALAGINQLQYGQNVLANEQRFLGTQEQLAATSVVTGNYGTFQTQAKFFQTHRFGPGAPGTPGGATGGVGGLGGLGGATGLPPTGAGGGFGTTTSGRPPSTPR